MNCDHCGRFFWLKRRHHRRFCSEHCRIHWHIAQRVPAPPRPKPTTRKCTICKQTKPLSEFWNKLSKCKPCATAAVADWKKNNPEKAAENRKRWRERNPHYGYRRALREFGLTLEDYERILEQQKGLCAICGESPNGRRLAVDHDHETGRVRGLLCWLCNTNLGRWNDSLGMLRSATAYLERYS